MPARVTTGSLKAEVVEELADVRRGVRDFTLAITLYREALDLHRAAPDYEPIQLVRVHRKLIQIATDAKWSVDTTTYAQISEVRTQSLPLLEASLREMQDREPHAETVSLFAALSMDAWRSQDPPDWESAQRFAQSGVDMAEQLDDPVVLSQALGALASVLDGRSLLREHLAVALRRLEISRDDSPSRLRAPRFDTRERIDALRGVGMGLMYVGEYEQALPHLIEAETLAARTQTIDQQANAVGIQAQCYLRLDRWDDVLKLEDKWRDLERRYSRERVGETCFFVALSASVLAMRGDLPRAELYRRESFEYMLSVSGTIERWQRNQFY
jgi:tetratricopeptide (TPR) repeat protein